MSIEKLPKRRQRRPTRDVGEAVRHDARRDPLRAALFRTKNCSASYDKIKIFSSFLIRQ
jgi:hypothetical protein